MIFFRVQDPYFHTCHNSIGDATDVGLNLIDCLTQIDERDEEIVAPGCDEKQCLLEAPRFRLELQTALQKTCTCFRRPKFPRFTIKEGTWITPRIPTTAQMQILNRSMPSKLRNKDQRWTSTGSVRVTIQFENVAFEQIVDINMQVIDHTRAAFIILCVVTPTRVVSLLRKSIRFGPCYVIPAVTRSNLVCCNRPDLVQPLAHGLFGLAANPIAKSYG